MIECSSGVLDQIRSEVENGRNSPRGEREMGGVLFGTHEPGRICILASRPLQCEHAMGPGFVLSEKDEQRLAQLISTPATDPEMSGFAALGWYHSHTRSRIFLSERDLLIHSRYFAAPHQIALVIHPASDRPARGGFFFREPPGVMRTESSYEEFTIKAPPPPVPLSEPMVASRPASSHRRRSSHEKPKPQQAATICPKCGSKRLQRSRRTGAIDRLRGVLGFHAYRREVLLWAGGVFGFLVVLYYLIRDTGPKPDWEWS